MDAAEREYQETLTFNCQEVCSVSSVLHAASVDAGAFKSDSLSLGRPGWKANGSNSGFTPRQIDVDIPSVEVDSPERA